MASIGSQYYFGRRKPLTTYQRFEAWRQFRRTQLVRLQERNQTFSTAFLRSYNQKMENASIVAAQSALDRIVSASQVKSTNSINGQLARLFDKRV